MSHTYEHIRGAFCDDALYKLTLTFTLHDVRRGGATVLKVGGQFCERSEQKKNFDPPLFGQWGDKILLLFRCLQAASRKIVDGVMRHTPG